MAFRRRSSARAPREPLYWERVCAGQWGFGIDDNDPAFDCESAEVRSGLVLATGEQSAFTTSADQQTTVRRVIWPTTFVTVQSFAASRAIVVAIVVVKTGKVVADFVGTSFTDLLNEEDVMDVRVIGEQTVPGAIAPMVNPDKDRRWELNVARKLQTTENIIALAVPAFTISALPAGGTLGVQLVTPVLSVLLQRTMRRR